MKSQLYCLIKQGFYKIRITIAVFWHNLETDMPWLSCRIILLKEKITKYKSRKVGPIKWQTDRIVYCLKPYSFLTTHKYIYTHIIIIQCQRES